ncbi:unnamed protein product [Notodromas monacha]|uniref:Mitochondrial genome maintenance exonuclease 1 n=1 Tax=Notodromas monacha TaxID=399045 RepID=A0A7R9BJL5_9CRUS|nr:unnamed protein product [Notodromas monacha]CAG0916421.1 unnamed protein product [Notodromas monacha]
MLKSIFRMEFLVRSLSVRLCSTKPIPRKIVRVVPKKSSKDALIRYHTENALLFGKLQKRKKPAKAEPKPDLSLVAALTECSTCVSEGRMPTEVTTGRVKMPLVWDLELKRASDSVDGFKDVVSSKVKSLPSVTKVLSATMSPESRAALDAWKQRMIAELGEDGFARMQQEILARGKELHSFILKRLSGGESSLVPEERIQNYVKSLRSVFTSVKKVDLDLTEKPICHPVLGYWGIPDCVAVFKGTPVVIDWKTSGRTRQTIGQLYDGPVQLSAYIGALNATRTLDQQLDHGVVVVAYDTGKPADVHVLSRPLCELFWSRWMQRLKLYQGLLLTTTH